MNKIEFALNCASNGFTSMSFQFDPQKPDSVLITVNCPFTTKTSVKICDGYLKKSSKHTIQSGIWPLFLILWMMCRFDVH